MASATAATNAHQEGEYPDEDTFLTALESKLRGPFSSVELTKFITPLTTPMIARVLHRAEKVTQLRILTGLLGVSLEEEEALREVVKIAQTAPDYEEWVRVIAGIVQDKLQLGSSVTDTEGINEEDAQEARKTLQDSCRDIIKRVREVERSSCVIDEDTEHLLGQSDIHPVFAPFHHFLDINPQSEANFTNDHFKVNQSADVLHIDARLEKEKAKEEALHKQTASISKAKTGGSAGSTGATLPGSKGGAARKKPIRPAPKKASMFMPTKKKVGAPVQKTLLRKRKGAQALVSQGRNRAVGSKTKLVNMDEVKNGMPEKQSLIPDLKRGRKMGGAFKRKAEAAETSKVARPRLSPASPPNPSVGSPSRTAARQQDWREMLEVRSNVLTQQDRERIRQFFEDRANPTPDVDSYRCKLHEERTAQEKTTYYIELDYKAFRSKQFSKIKKYT